MPFRELRLLRFITSLNLRGGWQENRPNFSGTIFSKKTMF